MSRIRRYSFFFSCTIALIIASAIFLAFAAFKSNITYEKCEKIGLPILKIETEYGKKIRSKTKYLDATYNFEGLTGKCKIRGHGNTTWRTRELYKKPYLLKTNEEVSFFGLPASRKWILLANTADKTSLRNFFALYLSKNVFNNFEWTPNQNFITLFVNGRYEGLYALTEKVEIQKGRIDIDSGSGSFLAEINLHLDRTWNFVSEANVPLSIRKPEDLTDKEYEGHQERIQMLENKIMSLKDFSAEPLSVQEKELSALSEIFDLDSAADWYIINEFTKNHDARDFSSNFFYFDSSTNKFFFSPVWDFDIALGNINWDGCENPRGWWIKDSVWFSALLSNDAFLGKVRARWNEKKSELKDSFSVIEKEASFLEPSIEINDAVWKNIGKRQWPHAPGWKNRKTYAAEVRYLTDWCKERFSWMDEELNAVR